jgi:Skp family chaperone for outer membrane proteins
MHSKTKLPKRKGLYSMEATQKRFFTFLTVAALTAGSWAQTAPSGPPTPARTHKAAAKPKQPAVTAADVQSLKDALAAQQQQLQEQQQQIQALQDQLQRREQAVQQVETSASDATAKADAAQAQANQQQQAVGELKIDVADLKTNFASTAATLRETQTSVNDLESPLSIHFKGLTITPGGFVAAEFVRRSSALGADVSTPFNSIAMPGASQSSMSEFFGSARQSRPTVFIEGRVKNVELSSYVSGDFLSAGVTSSATQTNSYTLRLRQAWGQAKFNNGWSVLGGQMWSLLTENKAGIGPSDDAGKVNDSRPMTIDSTYNVGFTFARQYGLRVTKDLGDKVWFAVAMENSEATITTHQNADNFLLGETGASNSYNTTSNYSFNPSPDIIAKLAFDPGFGHYEVFGIFDRFRDRVFPCVENFASTACGSSAAANADDAYNASKNGGGIGANARWAFDNKHFVFGLHGFGGSGVGRYGAGQLPDASIHADGTVDLIRGYQGLATFERHGSKLDVYFYTGTEYASRTADFDSTLNKEVGYGAPLFSNSGCSTEIVPSTSGTAGFNPGTLANCTADTRVLIEGTAGFWYRFYNGPKGKFQVGTQFSYVTRNTWSGVRGEPQGTDKMVFTSVRYYLP